MTIMPFALLLSLALVGDIKPDPDLFPLALHRSMEIDDLDREIEQLHHSVLMKRAQLGSTQRLAQKGLVSRGDLERETADVRYNEAREEEAVAFRALKAYERDVMGQVIPSDERKAYRLLLERVRKQLAIAQVDLDYREYLQKQTKALFARNSVNRQEMEDAELNFNTAQASVALSRSREAQVMMELAVRNGEKPYDPAEYHRLKREYLNARVGYFEINEDSARKRLGIARARIRLGLIPSAELGLFEKGAKDAADSLAAERKILEHHETESPDLPPKRSVDRSEKKLRKS